MIGTELLSTSERIDTPHPQGMLPTDTYMIWSVHTEFTHERVVKDPSPLQVNLEKGIYLENETRTNALLIVAHVFPHHLGFSRNMEAIDAYLANCTLRLEGLPFG